MKIVLKRSHTREWWGKDDRWTSDEAQAMVFSSISDAVDCGLLLRGKDLRVVVIGIPVARHLLNAREVQGNQGTRRPSQPPC